MTCKNTSKLQGNGVIGSVWQCAISRQQLARATYHQRCHCAQLQTPDVHCNGGQAGHARTCASAKAHAGNSWLSAAAARQEKLLSEMHGQRRTRCRGNVRPFNRSSLCPSLSYATAASCACNPLPSARRRSPLCFRNTGLASCANASCGAEFMLRKMADSTCTLTSAAIINHQPSTNAWAGSFIAAGNPSQNQCSLPNHTRQIDQQPTTHRDGHRVAPLRGHRLDACKHAADDQAHDGGLDHTCCRAVENGVKWA